MSELRWALHPGDEHCHAVAPGDLRKSGTLGYASALAAGSPPSRDRGTPSATRWSGSGPNRTASSCEGQEWVRGVELPRHRGERGPRVAHGRKAVALVRGIVMVAT
ncbi:MAG: hypothetical protein ACRDRX_02065 [Pseudonocardiaceae bacterium]